MLRKICRVCGSGMINWPRQGEMAHYCEKCSDFTPFDDLEMDAYCPDCGTLIIVCVSCGSHGFFCGSCKTAKSSKKVVWKHA